MRAMMRSNFTDLLFGITHHDLDLVFAPQLAHLFPCGPRGGGDHDVRLLAETEGGGVAPRGGGARHLHQSGTAVSPLRKVPTVVQPPGQASLNA